MKKICLTGFIAVFIILKASVGQLEKEREPATKYKEWLNLTEYISLPQERDVFLKLTSDRERDLFIEAFWKHRDPTAGTPQNEYKDEILRRFVYANRQFSRGGGPAGWRTDMGKIYIILGEPVSRERYEDVRGLYPCEAWYYYGDPAKGLPTYFGLLFFKRGGVGEFKLYNPLADGPASLLVDGQNYDPASSGAAFQRIKDAAPTLAPLSLSLIPGETPYGFQPSLQTEVILADIFSSARRDLSPAYATHFLNYRGIVSTDYLTNYVDIDGEVVVLPDPLQGVSFVHFTLAPRILSVEYSREKDRYLCNYSVDISLRDGENVVYQYSKEFPFDYAPAEDSAVRSAGAALEDSFPVIEGVHKLTILVRNSVSKEFSVYEKELKVERPAGPQIFGPLLGFRMEPAPVGLHSPFQVGERRLWVDPRHIFGQDDRVFVALALAGVGQEVWKSGAVRLTVKGLEGASPQEKAYEMPLAAYAFQKIMPMVHSFPAADWPANYYEIKLDLVVGTSLVAAGPKADFIVSPTPSMLRRVAIAKTFPLANLYLYDYMVADQYDKAGKLPEAASFYERAYALAPDYLEGIAYYADFLVKSGNPERALGIVEKFKDSDKLRFEYWLIKGRADMGLGKYQEAIECFLEGNTIYNSDTRLLNALGLSYFRIGEKKRALEALESSLRLNPEQPEIKRLVTDIQKLH
jgi:GWxTD domain-containing protein